MKSPQALCILPPHSKPKRNPPDRDKHKYQSSLMLKHDLQSFCSLKLLCCGLLPGLFLLCGTMSRLYGDFQSVHKHSCCKLETYTELCFGSVLFVIRQYCCYGNYTQGLGTFSVSLFWSQTTVFIWCQRSAVWFSPESRQTHKSALPMTVF